MRMPTALFIHEDGRRCVLHQDSDHFNFKTPRRIRTCKRDHPKKDWIVPLANWVKVLNNEQ